MGVRETLGVTPPPPSLVLFDFYGTLARATRWVSAADVLAARGYSLDAAAHEQWFNGGLDGIEHPEHSRSRDHYVAWQQERTLALLAASDVHPRDHEPILAALRAGTAERRLEAYPEVAAVLTELRARGIRIVICSNWDWDLAEAVAEAGLTELVDDMVSSAWVGARKPHPRIYETTLAQAGGDPESTVFVGDTWGPDAEGPRALGLRPVYLRRDGHWPDGTAPSADPGALAALGVTVLPDLRGVLDLV
jgi:putative hydrolase of the HAD superfamily